MANKEWDENIQWDLIILTDHSYYIFNFSIAASNSSSRWNWVCLSGTTSKIYESLTLIKDCTTGLLVLFILYSIFTMNPLFGFGSLVNI